MASRNNYFYSTAFFRFIRLLLSGLIPIVLISTTGAALGKFENNESTISKMLLNEINSNNIAMFLKDLTERPQLAGLEMDERMAKYVYEKWINQGLDHVYTANYTVLLSYPNATNPSQVSILDSNGSLIYASHTHEVPLNATEEEIPIYKEFPPFLAYAPSTGSKPVVGDLVYVNYGRAEDYDVLQKEGISVKERIAIARYGRLFRGDKLAFAQQYGAIGLHQLAKYPQKRGE